MNLITGLTDNPKQKTTLVLPSGKTVAIVMEFKPMQTGWFMTLTYGTFEIDSIRIVTSPNILHQFRHLIPFGVGCFVTDNQEALLQQDFSSGRAKLYLLDQTDMTQFEGLLSG